MRVRVHHLVCITCACASPVCITCVPSASQVMNLERSLRFTGDWFPRTRTDGRACAERGCAELDETEDVPESYGGQGIVTMATGSSARMTMKFHAISNCGRLLIGSYCHHFHIVRTSGGTIEGTVTTNSVNKAIVVHGTSHTLVTNNVIFQHRGAFVYYENGAEHSNTLSGNLFGCRFKNGCRLRNGVQTNTDSDFNEQAAIYLLQPNAADVIGNHVYGQENAHFINQQAFGQGAFGQDFANGYVATKAMRIANNSYNVYVDNAGFGWYMNGEKMRLEPTQPRHLSHRMCRAQCTRRSTCALTTWAVWLTGEMRCRSTRSPAWTRPTPRGSSTTPKQATSSRPAPMTQWTLPSTTTP